MIAKIKRNKKKKIFLEQNDKEFTLKYFIVFLSGIRHIALCLKPLDTATFGKVDLCSFER